MNQLEQENIKLKQVLKRIKSLMEDVEVIINVDIEGNSPSHSVKIYNLEGDTAGAAKMKINDTRMTTKQSDLFNKSGYVTYKGNLNLFTLLGE